MLVVGSLLMPFVHAQCHQVNRPNISRQCQSLYATAADGPPRTDLKCQCDGRLTKLYLGLGFKIRKLTYVHTYIDMPISMMVELPGPMLLKWPLFSSPTTRFRDSKNIHTP